MSCTAEQTHFWENLRLHLIDLSRRLEQDLGDDVADYVLYRLQQVARHLTRVAASAPGNVFEEVQLSLGEITSVLEDAERSWLPVSFAVHSTGSVGLFPPILSSAEKSPGNEVDIFVVLS